MKNMATLHSFQCFQHRGQKIPRKYNRTFHNHNEYFSEFLVSTSPEQKAELVEFLKNHPQLTTGKFTNDFTFKKSRDLWQSLSTTLNSMPGANKDWKKWRKTWHDIKTRTKSKSSKVKQHRVRTGGGPPINIEITKDDEKILGIMGSVVVEGHPNVSESHVLFEDSTITDYHGTVPTSEKHSTKDEHCYSLVDLEVSPNILDITNSDNLRKSSTSYFNEPIPTTSAHLLDKTNSSTTNVYEANKDMNKIKKKIIHVPKRLQRFDKTISATQTLADQTERDITMRQEYLCKKLDLYKEDIAVKARIASALESIAQSIV